MRRWLVLLGTLGALTRCDGTRTGSDVAADVTAADRIAGELTASDAADDGVGASLDASGPPDAPALPPDLPASARPDPQRPQFHFAPLGGWMNDPNGLVFADGEFHLFYQHNPDAILPGNTHWGHAVSADLVHWLDLPPALGPDAALGLPFSGSAVVARGPAASLCPDAPLCLAALFTHHGGTTGGEKQSLATSGDRGRTWHPFAANPVLPNPGDLQDFRDPKVMWYAPTSRWVMALAAGADVRLYTSPDLVAWTFASAYTPDGLVGPLECPDLVSLEGPTGTTRWVLLLSLARASGPAVWYVVGDFDGTRFVATSPPRPLDGGRDFYAPQTWSDVPDGRRVLLAWMGNWSDTPAAPEGAWRGAMTVPRVLALGDRPDGPVLLQEPVVELAALRAGRVLTLGPRELTGRVPLDTVGGATLDVQVELVPGDARTVGLAVRVGDDEETRILYDAVDGELVLDRSAARAAGPVGASLGRLSLPVPLVDGAVALRVLVDTSSVEVLADEGAVVLTARVFPDAASTGLALFAEEGRAQVRRLEVEALRTIWPADE